MDLLPKINYCAIAPEKGDKSQLYYVYSLFYTLQLGGQIFSKYLAKVCPYVPVHTFNSSLSSARL